MEPKAYKVIGLGYFEIIYGYNTKENTVTVGQSFFGRRTKAHKYKFYHSKKRGPYFLVNNRRRYFDEYTKYKFL